MKNKYELTFPQKNIWLVDKVNQDTPINVIVCSNKCARDRYEK
ncbi:MAG: hypothetical protein RSA08_01600 [Clostridia bacterium]